MFNDMSIYSNKKKFDMRRDTIRTQSLTKDIDINSSLLTDNEFKNTVVTNMDK